MLDPRIILAGQGPDTMGAFTGGLQAGAMKNQIGRQNALADLYRTQGAGIMAGDPGALNALAGMDPMAAMNVQKQRLGMDATRQDMRIADQRMGILSAQEMRQAEEYARSLTAQQAAAEAQKLESAVKMGMMIPDAATWDAQMSQMAPELVGKFDQRQALAAKFMSMAEVLKQTRGPEIPGGAQTLAWRAQQAGLQPGTAEYTEFMVTGGKADGLAIDVDPATGSVSVRQGVGAAKTRPLTEGQSKDNVFATRAKGALAAFEPVADVLTSFGQRAAEMDPTGVVRGSVQSPEFQVAKNAGDEFLQAILRKDTGAAITSQEQELYGKTYLPQPGDGPAVLEAKRQARSRALAALESGMSPDQVATTERALVDAARRVEKSGSPPQSAPGPAVGDDPLGIFQ